MTRAPATCTLVAQSTAPQRVRAGVPCWVGLSSPTSSTSLHSALPRRARCTMVAGLHHLATTLLHLLQLLQLLPFDQGDTSLDGEGP